MLSVMAASMWTIRVLIHLIALGAFWRTMPVSFYSTYKNAS